MPQTPEERRAANREYYAKWRAANPDYYRNRRKALGSALLEKERERDRQRKQAPYRKEAAKVYRHSEAYKAAKKTRRQTRRARLKGAFVETVVSTVVFERDLYVCQQCWKQCPSKAAVPDPDAPTVDHILALANGGEHSYANTQCLCFTCNSAKGAN